MTGDSRNQRGRSSILAGVVHIEPASFLKADFNDGLSLVRWHGLQHDSLITARLSIISAIVALSVLL